MKYVDRHYSFIHSTVNVFSLLAENPCELNCRALTFRFYALLNKTVIDGTLCRPNDPSRVCVAGTCKVGHGIPHFNWIGFYYVRLEGNLYNMGGPKGKGTLCNPNSFPTTVLFVTGGQWG